jgi:hypothetical protein
MVTVFTEVTETDEITEALAPKVGATRFLSTEASATKIGTMRFLSKGRCRMRAPCFMAGKLRDLV